MSQLPVLDLLTESVDPPQRQSALAWHRTWFPLNAMMLRNRPETSESLPTTASGRLRRLVRTLETADWDLQLFRGPPAVPPPGSHLLMIATPYLRHGRFGYSRIATILTGSTVGARTTQEHLIAMGLPAAVRFDGRTVSVLDPTVRPLTALELAAMEHGLPRTDIERNMLSISRTRELVNERDARTLLEAIELRQAQPPDTVIP